MTVKNFLFQSFVCALAVLKSASAGEEREKEEVLSSSGAKVETAIFAGGCFWCVEADLEKLDGVGDVISGYAGGDLANPTYRNHEGHVEAVRVPYNPEVISYRALTDYFLRHIDPTDSGGQFCDRGYAYTTAIFYKTEEQKIAALAAIQEAESVLGQQLVTPIRAHKKFWIAEDYHQNYYKKNPVRYQFYRRGCRRDARVKAIWGEQKKAETTDQ